MDYCKFVCGIILIYGLNSHGDCSMVKRADNASADTLILTTILGPPYMMQVDGQTNVDGSPKLEGFLIDLWEKLIQQLGNKYNKYKIDVVKDSRYGSMNADGTWNGMIGELIKEEADVALAALSVTSMRENVIDFTQPYLNIENSVMLRKDLAIDDVEDLLRNEEVSYGCIDSGRTMSLFKQHTVPTVEKMYSTMQSKEPSVYVMTTEKAVERTKQEKYAFIGESTTIDYIIARECELKSFPFEHFPETGLGIAFRKGSKYSSEFSSAILSMRESGEVQRLYNKWWKPTCSGVSGYSQNVAHIGAVMTLLAVLLL